VCRLCADCAKLRCVAKCQRHSAEEDYSNRQALYVMGIYKDEFVRTAEGWRFKTLTFTPAAFSPYELGWGKAQFAPSESQGA
jgi:hypothetical protein